MGIVNGIYQNKLETIFEIDKGIEAIKETIIRSRKVRINTIPSDLLESFVPLLKEKDVKILLSIGEKPIEELKKVGGVAISKARIYADYKGEEVIVGNITFPGISYNILWRYDSNEPKKSKIYEISALNYEKCVRCLGDSFEELTWRFADKIEEQKH